MNDTMESSEEISQNDGGIASIDLNVRYRKFNEENNYLKQDLMRCEETISGLERELSNSQELM